MKRKKLIHHGIVRQGSGKTVRYLQADILVEGGMISRIGPGLTDEDAEPVEAEGKIVIPGLVNAHLHSHDNFNKAWLDNMPLEIWMPAVRPFFSGVRHTERQVYLRTIAGAMEMLHCGTTAVMDDVLLNGILDQECLDTIIRAYQDIGIRAVVSPHTKNIAMEKTIPYAEELFTVEMKKATCGPYPEVKDILSFFRENLERYNRPDNRVTVGLSDSAPQRCTTELMFGVQELARQYRVPVSSHILETYVQKKTGDLFYGKSLVKYLADLGLLDENFVLIHCNWADAEDIRLMAQYGSKAVHNPVCNMKMGSGIAPIYEMLKDIPVGLGTDNISANDGANLFESMKSAALLSKLRTPDYRKWLGGADAVDMATVHGSCCLRQEDRIGTLEEGKKADLALISMGNEQYVLSGDYDNALAYCENGSHVDMVMVDGELVVQGGKLTKLNEEEILKELSEQWTVVRKEHMLAEEECRVVTEVFARCYERCNQERMR